MARPSKSRKVIEMEGRSHRTKKELALRGRMEAETMTGVSLREEKRTAENPVAHKEFVRVRKLLKLIEKNDELYAAEINLYCQLKAEIEEEFAERERLHQRLERVDEMAARAEGFVEMRECTALAIELKKQIAGCDRSIKERRAMRLDIENKNLMNIASSLRSIPKTPEKKSNPLKEALGS